MQIFKNALIVWAHSAGPEKINIAQEYPQFFRGESLDFNRIRQIPEIPGYSRTECALGVWGSYTIATNPQFNNEPGEETYGFITGGGMPIKAISRLAAIINKDIWLCSCNSITTESYRYRITINLRKHSICQLQPVSFPVECYRMIQRLVM